jgi:hypothetical protein
LRSVADKWTEYVFLGDRVSVDDEVVRRAEIVGNRQLAVLLAVAVVSCQEVRFIPAVSVSSNIELRLQAGAKTITVRDLTDFRWDELFVFGPYTPIEQIERTLRTPAPQLVNNHLERHDTFNLLVFRAAGRIVRQEQCPRSKADFAKDVLATPLSPVTAVFSVNRESGRSTLSRTPVG